MELQLATTTRRGRAGTFDDNARTLRLLASDDCSLKVGIELFVDSGAGRKTLAAD